MVNATDIVEIINKKSMLKPWMTSYLLKKIHLKNKLAKKIKIHPEKNEYRKKFKRLTQIIKNEVQIAKNNYHKQKFERITNSKQKWKFVDDVISGCGSSSNTITSISGENAELLVSPLDIANRFNNFFVNIPDKLISDSSESYDFPNNLKNVLLYDPFVSETCFLYPVNEEEIVRTIASLKNSYSTGADGISSILLKKHVHNLIPALNHIFNQCFFTGIFPEDMKLATVIPLFKKDDKLNVNNYRPISLLNSLSKVLEKILKTRIMDFANKNNLISDLQYGFRMGRSTEDAILNFIGPVYENMNSGKKVAAMFIDISKAFDTVSHSILLNKLYNYGFRGASNKLFKSYLTSRMQSVRIGDSLSESLKISRGVPQGSVLGPILFLFYIQSLFKLPLKGEITAFADDMGLTYVGNDYEELHAQISSDLDLLKKWFTAHEMVLSDKTKIMFFNLVTPVNLDFVFKYHSLHCDKINCDVRCLTIDVVPHFKYLGITLDSKLSWGTHIENLKNNLMFMNRKFYLLRFYASTEILRMVYFALVNSRIEYGIVCWGNAYMCTLKPLITIQKHIVRVISFKRRYEHSYPLFKKLNVLPIRNLYVYKVLRAFYIRSGHLNKKQTHYGLRNTRKCLYKKPNSENYRKSFLFVAPFLFNILPEEVQNQRNLKKFLVSLKYFVSNKNPDEIALMFRIIK